MLSFAEALKRVLSSAEMLGSERVDLLAAAGRVLARDVIAAEPLPRFDYSAMDGYAVASRDFAGSGPWCLPVSGESRAGSPQPVLAARGAVRIFTGGPLPRGADAVVAQEDAREVGDQIELAAAPRSGEHVRRRGEDLAQGAVGLERGARLGAHQLGLAAALDCSELVVARRPRVSILSTGDELRAPGEAGSPTSVPESNSIAIAVQAESAGAVARILPRAHDDAAALTARLTAALADTDLLITIGGVSVGRYDLVRPALLAAGAQIDFWKIAIKPGKPLVYGQRGATRILGLPGNPVSSQLTFALFGVPLLRALQGQRDASPRFQSARLLADLRQRPGRMGFYRAELSESGVTPLDNQASGNTASLARADALIAVAAESEGFAAGEMVPILRLAEL